MYVEEYIHTLKLNWYWVLWFGMVATYTRTFIASPGSWYVLWFHMIAASLLSLSMASIPFPGPMVCCYTSSSLVVQCPTLLSVTAM